MIDLSYYIKVSGSPNGCSSYDAEQFKCDRYLDCESCLEDKIIEHDKHIIEQYKENTKLKETIKDIHDNVAQEMYYKGINDFAILMKEALNYDWFTTKISEQIIYNRLFDECNRIAEQLKAGGKI